MRIAMFTNTYPPIVGGVSRCVENWTNELRRQGHTVVVVAPKPAVAGELGVVRLPALRNVGGSVFSLPLPALLSVPFAHVAQLGLAAFQPDVIHSHHPWLLGETALSAARALRVPLVFTYHTSYGAMAASAAPSALKPVADLGADVAALRYAKQCSWVVSPSSDVTKLLRQRGLTRVRTVAGGVDVTKFQPASKCAVAAFRRRYRLGDAHILGHVGRLSAEKNLGFLGRALLSACKATGARALVVGDGDGRAALEQTLGFHGAFTGSLAGDELVTAYSSMQVFGFSSLSETLGLVVAEALSCGTPVVALDAPGVRDSVQHGRNGLLLAPHDLAGFGYGLEVMLRRRASRAAVRASVIDAHGLTACVLKAVKLYRQCCGTRRLMRYLG